MNKKLILITLIFLALPLVSAYSSTTDPSVMPIVVAIGISLAVLIVLAIALATTHPTLSVVFAGVSLFLLNPLLQIGMTYLDLIDAVSMNVETMHELLLWMDYAIIVYICVYIMVKAISNYGQEKREKMEGLR